MNRSILILIAAAFFAGSACQPPAPTANRTAPQNPASSPQNIVVPEVAPTPTPNLTGMESAFTDIEAGKCKTGESNKKEGWSIRLCEGFAGYRFEVYQDEIRQSMNVISPTGEKSELDFQTLVAGGHSTFAQSVEWRYKKIDGKPVPMSFMVQFNSNDPKADMKSTPLWVVVKVSPAGSCITDVVANSPTQVEEARAFADNIEPRPCRTANQ